MKLIKTVPQQNLYFHQEEISEGNAPATTEDCIVNVFDDITYQEVLGFGGAFTESAAYNYSLMDDATKKLFMELYFDRQNGIGYNMGRTHINSCDFSVDIYSYVKEGDTDLSSFHIDRDKKYIIPFLKDAMKYCDDELFLFASPWSPPAYMKDNSSMIRGGKLKDEYKTVWAKYYAKYIKAFANEGIKISAITIQNEPHAVQSWESCWYEPEDEASFIGTYLIPALDRENLSDVKIIIWDHNKERVYDRAKKVLSTSAVNERVWAVGHHWYSGDHFDGLRLVYEQLHKPLICTEFCGGIDSDAHVLAERYIKEMCGNFNNYEIGSCDWNILLSNDGGPYHNRTEKSTARPGVIYESKDGGCHAPILYHQAEKKMIVTPIYYYIGHFSKYVMRHAKRIATTKYTEQIAVCGFQNPDNSIAVVLANLADNPAPITLRRNDICTSIELEPHSAATVLFEK